MAANDYLMRQIEDMARFLGKVLFVKTEETIPLFDEQGNVLESGLLYKRLCAMLEEGDANSAENLLFDEVEAHPDPAYLQVAVQFYADLQHWTDAALEAADFSRPTAVLLKVWINRPISGLAQTLAANKSAV